MSQKEEIKNIEEGWKKITDLFRTSIKYLINFGNSSIYFKFGYE